MASSQYIGSPFSGIPFSPRAYCIASKIALESEDIMFYTELWYNNNNNVLLLPFFCWFLVISVFTQELEKNSEKRTQQRETHDGGGSFRFRFNDVLFFVRVTPIIMFSFLLLLLLLLLLFYIIMWSVVSSITNKTDWKMKKQKKKVLPARCLFLNHHHHHSTWYTTHKRRESKRLRDAIEEESLCGIFFIIFRI